MEAQAELLEFMADRIEARRRKATGGRRPDN